MMRANKILVLGIWCVVNVTIPSGIVKGCYFVLRNRNCIAVGRELQTFSQECVINDVPRWEHGEYICYLGLTTD